MNVGLRYIYEVLCSFAFCSSKKSNQNVDEYDYDIQIEVEGGKNIVFWVKGVPVFPSKHHLGVEDKV